MAWLINFSLGLFGVGILISIVFAILFEGDE